MCRGGGVDVTPRWIITFPQGLIYLITLAHSETRISAWMLKTFKPVVHLLARKKMNWIEKYSDVDIYLFVFISLVFNTCTEEFMRHSVEIINYSTQQPSLLY